MHYSPKCVHCQSAMLPAVESLEGRSEQGTPMTNRVHFLFYTGPSLHMFRKQICQVSCKVLFLRGSLEEEDQWVEQWSPTYSQSQATIGTHHFPPSLSISCLSHPQLLLPQVININHVSLAYSIEHMSNIGNIHSNTFMRGQREKFLQELANNPINVFF